MGAMIAERAILVNLDRHLDSRIANP